MRMHVKELLENWYHGSPWMNFGDMSNFRGKIIFLSDSEVVAR
jgi:hypothetical protein